MKKIITKLTMVVLSGICGSNVHSAADVTQSALDLTYVVDGRYVQYATVSATSAILNKPDGMGLNIHLIYADNDPEKTKPFSSIFGSLPAKDLTAGTYNLDVIHMSQDQLTDLRGLDSYSWSPAIYAKLLSPSILKGERTVHTGKRLTVSDSGEQTSEDYNELDADVEKYILIDADTIVTDVNALWQLCHGASKITTAVGMVEDFSFLRPESQFPWLTRYNAGVVFIDSRKVEAKRDNLFRSLAFGQEEVRRNAGKRPFGQTCTEEHVLAIVFRNDITTLCPICNMLNCFMPGGYTGPSSALVDPSTIISLVQKILLDAFKKPAVIHYSDSEKVWTKRRDEWIADGHSPYTWDLWFDTYERTPYCK